MIHAILAAILDPLNFLTTLLPIRRIAITPHEQLGQMIRVGLQAGIGTWDAELLVVGGAL